MFFSRIERELKEIKEKQTKLSETLSVNTVHLQEHMRRTDLLEKRLDSVWSRALTALSIMSGLAVLLKLILT